LNDALTETRLNAGRARCSTALYLNNDDVVRLLVPAAAAGFLVTGCGRLPLSATDNISKQLYDAVSHNTAQ